MQPLSATLLSGGSIIDLDGSFFVVLVVFFVAFFMLRALVFKPMIALFEAREAATEGAKAEAARLEREAASAGQQFEDELKKVRVQAAKEAEVLRADAQKREREILDQVRAETEKTTSDADKKLATEAAALRRDLVASTPALAKQIASKLLSREVA